ncbi:FHA domain-containing protein [Spirosoma areae]
MPSSPAAFTDGQFEQLIGNLSQLPTFTIGRGADNELIVPNSKVSSHHARLIQCTPTSFLFEDLSSKNGSFVNGIRVTRKIVDSHDTLRLADADFTVDELLALRKVDPIIPMQTAPPVPPGVDNRPDALDFTGQFADLQQVHEQYPQLRRDCRNREKMIRTGSVILSSIVGISAVFTTGGSALPLLHILSGAGLSVLVPTLCSTLLSTEEKLEVIDKEYRERYRCPNPTCRDPFGAREWDLLAQQKSCRRCQAVWVK